MKILIVSPTFPPMSSGGADFALRLGQHLAKAGKEACMVTSDIPNITLSEEFKILPVMHSWGWGELNGLLKIARHFGPDVVEIHFSGAIYHHHPMITALPALLKRQLNGVRVILHIEYPEPVNVSRRWSPSWLMRKVVMGYYGRLNVSNEYGTLLSDSDRIIVLCDSHVNLLAEHYPEVARKCVMIPPPPSIQFCDNTGGQARQRGRAELMVAPTDIVLAYYGYIYPNKGIETLIKAIELVARQTPAIRLVLIGGANEIVLKAWKRPNYLKELADYTEQLGVADKVTWTSYFPSESEQPSVLLRAADIGVLPFDDGISMHRSTFGVAAVHDLPIISTRGKHLESQFIDGQNVLLCPPKDPQALAETISRLIADPALQKHLREGVRAMTDKYFTWDKCMEQTLRVFEGGTHAP